MIGSFTVCISISAVLRATFFRAPHKKKYVLHLLPHSQTRHQTGRVSFTMKHHKNSRSSVMYDPHSMSSKTNVMKINCHHWYTFSRYIKRVLTSSKSIKQTHISADVQKRNIQLKFFRWTSGLKTYSGPWWDANSDMHEFFLLLRCLLCVDTFCVLWKDQENLKNAVQIDNDIHVDIYEVELQNCN